MAFPNGIAVLLFLLPPGILSDPQMGCKHFSRRALKETPANLTSIREPAIASGCPERLVENAANARRPTLAERAFGCPRPCRLLFTAAG